MKMIDAQRVHQLMEYEGLVEALRKAHQGEMPKLSDRIIYQEPNPEGQPDSFILLPAWQPGEGLLCKLVTVFPNNRAKHDVANINSIYTYYHGETGLPEAVIEGESMIFRKTSADSALGASILAREDATALLMIGAGGLAPYMVRAHLSVRPSIRKVMVWNRTIANAENMVEMLGREGIPAELVTDLDDATDRADIVCAATMATEPLVRGKALRPGTHVDLVGSFTPEMRESDDDVLLRGRIFVDHRQTTERSGEFTGPYERGVIRPEDIRGDLFALCQGRVSGRTTDSDITVFKNGGGAHLDYWAARYLVQRMNEQTGYTP
jgi:ornithine cyclodeaminase